MKDGPSAGNGGDFGYLNDCRLQRSFYDTKWAVVHSDSFPGCGNLNVRSVIRLMGRVWDGLKWRNLTLGWKHDG
jgi:hypothetical protein